MNETFEIVTCHAMPTVTCHTLSPAIHCRVTLVVYLYYSDQEFDNFVKARQVLDELDITQHRLADCLVLNEVCKVVSTRAAYLAAAGSYLKFKLILPAVGINNN